jgi:protein-S-isoprenylcysteine O-methyltransferase Ste14
MSISKLAFGVLLNVSIFGCSLFLPAGTLNWWRAWVFLAVTFVAAIASTVILYRTSQELLKERFKPPLQEGQPLADKIIVVLLLAAIIGCVVFIPLDVFRFHLLAKPGLLVSSLGLPLYLMGLWLMTRAMLDNAFATLVVRLQEERHQRVIDTGAYSIVRHPMYAGVFPFLAGMALWLESYAAAILATVPAAILAVRILIEERFLKRKLQGYEDYTKKVRYRLIPYIW